MTYVRNAWYVAGFEMDLDAGKPLAAMILGEPLVFFRTAAGRVVALEDRCVHRLAPLSLGRCEGDHIRCMYHGLKFDADGKCVEIPGQELIPAMEAALLLREISDSKEKSRVGCCRRRGTSSFVDPAVALQSCRDGI